MKSEQPIDDGGPAFPSHGSMGEVVTEGMSLRNWLAGQAVPGLIEGYDFEMREKSLKDKVPFRTGFDDFAHPDSQTTWAEHLADDAYAIADAMIAARKIPK
jgi:hypothetical protein